MYTKLKKVNEGFTIVETLIVLAIAALIITVVLIAVPDLQRSSRNTDILHDAQNVASAVQTYESNNNGALPTNAAGAVSGPTITIGIAASAQATASVQANDSVYFGSGAEGVKYKNPTPTAELNTIGPGDLVVDLDATCGTTGATNTTVASTRGVAVLYPIEANGIGSVGCIQE